MSNVHKSVECVANRWLCVCFPQIGADSSPVNAALVQYSGSFCTADLWVWNFSGLSEPRETIMHIWNRASSWFLCNLWQEGRNRDGDRDRFKTVALNIVTRRSPGPPFSALTAGAGCWKVAGEQAWPRILRSSEVRHHLIRSSAKDTLDEVFLPFSPWQPSYQTETNGERALRAAPSADVSLDCCLSVLCQSVHICVISSSRRKLSFCQELSRPSFPDSSVISSILSPIFHTVAQFSKKNRLKYKPSQSAKWPFLSFPVLFCSHVFACFLRCHSLIFSFYQGLKFKLLTPQTKASKCCFCCKILVVMTLQIRNIWNYKMTISRWTYNLWGLWLWHPHNVSLYSRLHVSGEYVQNVLVTEGVRAPVHFKFADVRLELQEKDVWPWEVTI